MNHGELSADDYELWVSALRHRNRKLERRLAAARSEVERLQKAERDFSHALEQAKLDALKELAYGASHEINNPLANIAGRAQTLLKEEHDSRRRRMLESIHAQAMRAHEMIADLMLFARPPALDPAAVDVRDVISELTGELAPDVAALHIALHTCLPATCGLARVDRTQISVALRALLDNSLEALGAGGDVVVGCRGPSDGDNRIELYVRDTGPGIPAEIREHIFDPFFSGREAGRGLGFGLSKCWRIVTDHGGEVRVESQPAQGTLFTLLLPAAIE